jgi:ABC-type antimicrobial peptide transport system ATPase subunit
MFKFLLQQPWNSLEHKVRNSIILTFTSSITNIDTKQENLLFISTDYQVIQEWGIDIKPIYSSFQN